MARIVVVCFTVMVLAWGCNSIVESVTDYGESIQNAKVVKVQEEGKTERTKIEWSARVKIARIQLQESWPYVALWTIRAILAIGGLVWLFVGVALIRVRKVGPRWVG